MPFYQHTLILPLMVVSSFEEQELKWLLDFLFLPSFDLGAIEVIILVHPDNLKANSIQSYCPNASSIMTHERLGGWLLRMVIVTYMPSIQPSL
jgi:hypothetical protein